MAHWKYQMILSRTSGKSTISHGRKERACELRYVLIPVRANGAIEQERGRTRDDTRIKTVGITNKGILR